MSIAPPPARPYEASYGFRTTLNWATESGGGGYPRKAPPGPPLPLLLVLSFCSPSKLSSTFPTNCCIACAAAVWTNKIDQIRQSAGRSILQEASAPTPFEEMLDTIFIILQSSAPDRKSTRLNSS